MSIHAPIRSCCPIGGFWSRGNRCQPYPYVAFIIHPQNLLSSRLLHRYNARMSEPRLSHTAAMILQAISAGFVYGFSIMEMTGLPSGTVYPAMRRLERDDLIRSQWEKQSIADAEQRPPRKYYRLTADGKSTLEASRKRYPLLERLITTEEAKS